MVSGVRRAARMVHSRDNLHLSTRHAPPSPWHISTTNKVKLETACQGPTYYMCICMCTRHVYDICITTPGPPASPHNAPCWQHLSEPIAPSSLPCRAAEMTGPASCFPQLADTASVSLLGCGVCNQVQAPHHTSLLDLFLLLPCSRVW